MFKEVFANVGFANNLSGKILEISSDKKSLIVEVPGVYGLNPSKKYQKRKVFSSIEVQPQRTGSMTFLKSEVQRLGFWFFSKFLKFKLKSRAKILDFVL